MTFPAEIVGFSRSVKPENVRLSRKARVLLWSVKGRHAFAAQCALFQRDVAGMRKEALGRGGEGDMDCQALAVLVPVGRARAGRRGKAIWCREERGRVRWQMASQRVLTHR